MSHFKKPPIPVRVLDDCTVHMVILNNGQIIIWTPDLRGVAKLANSIPEIVNKMRPTLKAAPYEKQAVVYQEYLKILGYQLQKKLKDWKITASDLAPIRIANKTMLQRQLPKALTRGNSAP